MYFKFFLHPCSYTKRFKVRLAVQTKARPRLTNNLVVLVLQR